MKNREIKFRAWDKREGKLLFGLEPALFLSFIGGVYQGFDEYGDSHDWSKYIVLMQYTGLKDKHGKEIYEGDILLYKDAELEVTWCNGGFKLMERASMLSIQVGDGWLSDILKTCHCHDNQVDDIEVIGNIYETPQLLDINGSGSSTVD